MHRAADSKWFDLVRSIVNGQPVTCHSGGKEVHAADVARAVQILLSSDGIAGEVYNCCDLYVSQWDVAQVAKLITGSAAKSGGANRHRNIEL